MKIIELLKTFSEPQRLRILNLFQTSDLTVSELVEILELSQSNVSHHLKILKNQKLIDFYKNGNLKYYRRIEKPDLPPNLLNIWDELKSTIKEPIETAEDERRLIEILSRRENIDVSNTINFWRKQQPDLMFTADFAMGGIPESGIALDVGCGNGEFFKVIEHAFELILGVDNSYKQLKLAREQNMKPGKIRLIQSGAEILPISDECVNSVYFRMVLGFLKNPVQALNEACRVLKTKGKISIIDRDETSQRFNEKFFQKFLESRLDFRLLKFQNISGLIFCVLEKE